MHVAASLNGLLRSNLNLARQNSTPILWNPNKVIGDLIVTPARFTGLQCITHMYYNSSMHDLLATVVRRYVFPTLSRKMLARISDGRGESAKVWMHCRDIHQAARKNHLPWPNRTELQKATKGQFALHSQSIQMVCHAFLANVYTAAELRRQGQRKQRYPWRDKRYYPLLWPEQAVCVKDNYILLPMGRGRASIVLPKPEGFVAGCCKLIWNGSANELHVTVTVPAESTLESKVTATVDLGQIHQCAVTTNTGKALIVSGRGQRSLKRRQNQMHGEIASLQSRCTKGSRRYKKLARARHKHAGRLECQVRDLAHKGTRAVVDFCAAEGVGKVFIGDPHGVRRKNNGRKHNQRMAQWEYGRDKNYLAQKLNREGIASFTGSERGTSSRCPQCGHKHKPRGRWWSCKACGFQGHRDLVGSVNMHEDNFEKLTLFPSLKDVTYLRPSAISVAQAGRIKNCRLGSSSRPVTGHRESDSYSPASVLLFEHCVSTTDCKSTDLQCRASSEAGHYTLHSTEAHSL